jgi:hypothetical protein
MRRTCSGTTSSRERGPTMEDYVLYDIYHFMNLLGAICFLFGIVGAVVKNV